MKISEWARKSKNNLNRSSQSMGYCSIESAMFSFLGLTVCMVINTSFAQNQTESLTSLQFGNAPFQLKVEEMQMDYPGLPGLHSGATCVVQGDRVLLFMVAGRANEAGMHGLHLSWLWLASPDTTQAPRTIHFSTSKPQMYSMTTIGH